MRRVSSWVCWGEAARDKARREVEEAEQKAVEDTEKDQGNDDLAMEVTGSLAEVLPDADPRELKWPVTDVFVADAMSDYVEVLESAGIPDKQLKRYHNYMRESVMFGEGAEREKGRKRRTPEEAGRAPLQKQAPLGTQDGRDSQTYYFLGGASSS